ncbi:MAG TPA: multicopper oxidase domain-containing protein [Vicinamibacterales bacterium]|nr:multicopper oxidase domain-containing protein [Vicinamibacterales bacterium]
MRALSVSTPDTTFRVLMTGAIAAAISIGFQVAGAAVAVAQPSLERIAINDNRRTAGVLEASTLTVRLEVRLGEWRPDGDDGHAVVVKAFAEGNGPPQVPGPLIRVVEGTRIRAVVRNRLDEPVFVHGFYTRPGEPTAVAAIPPGETREQTFLAGTPGTYYYWAATDATTPLPLRRGRDTQLGGGLVVDPPGATASDRVLLIGAWQNDLPVGDPGRVSRFVINGRSWPHTERLAYRVGDTVRMRVVNAGAAVHPMHLHGFYFNVDSRGSEAENIVYAATGSPRMVVTERLTPGRTLALTWKPTRPGNWLFHCHDNVHLGYGGNLDGTPRPPTPHLHVANHALEMMAGPVMGITITGVSSESSPAPDVERRLLRLTARVDDGGTAEDPAFGYSLAEGSRSTPSSPPYLPGPTILLKRNEPVTITVVNELPEPTSVHWHGIELESYYDGVPDFAGDDKRVARPIASGGSFDARFTPPRSGTFIYHTHLDDIRQQRAGLSGPLLVVDDPAAYDPSHDFVLLVTIPRKRADGGVVLLNGSSTPAARELRVGERYRLRFINVHISRPSMRMRLLQGSTLQRWRAIAKDGMDLPADQALESPSEVQMGNGETYDFEFVPAAVGDLKLDITQGDGTLLTTMPIHVR